MPGKIILSFDFELGWGVVGNGQWRAREAAGVYRDLRPALRKLVKQLDTLEMSFTWAAVGAMITPPEDRDLSHLRGGYADKIADFIASAAPDTHDGRDLLDMVLGARTSQAFATHTYSHLLFSDPEQGVNIVSADLVKARRANELAGLDSTRLVFPENRSGHLEAVRATGIEVARMPAYNGHSPMSRPPLPIRAIASLTRPPSPVIEARDSSGLVLHYATELLNWGAGAGRVKQMVTRKRISSAINLAASGAEVHFWIHPFDLTETAGLAAYLEQFLFRIAALRDRGLLETAVF